MNQTVNEIRQFLFTCSGEDNLILKKCNRQIKKRFALIGFFVLIIFVGCFLSASFFSYCLFEGAKWMSVPMGIIWGAVVVNIYLLLLHTISPSIIPSLKKKERKSTKINEIQDQNRFLNLSMFLRMSFMVVLAIIIAQPLNVSFLSFTVKDSIEKYKIQERVSLYVLYNKELVKKEHIDLEDLHKKIKYNLNVQDALSVNSHIGLIDSKIKSDSLFIATTPRKLINLNNIDENFWSSRDEKLKKKNLLLTLNSKLENGIASDKSFIDSLNSIKMRPSLAKEYNSFKVSLTNLMTEKIKNYNSLNDLLNKSNFYVKTIRILLSENPFSWVITLSICIIFLLPIFLKYNARDLSATIFNKEKNDSETVKLRAELINTKDFNWLEKKIKTTNIGSVQTSDYYFQRMLIEHKIILEEYDETKKKFSQILTAHIKQYNRDSLVRLDPLLDKLKQVHLNKYNEISQKIYYEYIDEEMLKYEYWLDCPFRTKHRNVISIPNNEQELLGFIYNQED